MATLDSRLQTSRYSSRTYYLFVLFFAFIGLINAGYLSVSHYRNFVDFNYQSFCAISRSLNCDTVSQSPYAIFIDVPVAVWGGIGYAFFLALLFALNTAVNNDTGWIFFVFVASVFSMCSIVLAFISFRYVRSYCLMCIVSYGISFIMLLLTWMAQKRFDRGQSRGCIKQGIELISHQLGRLSLIFSIFFIISLMAILLYPKYWLFKPLPMNPAIHYGVTEDGSPWIGARAPKLTITEFTDYMCFQCGKMHNHLRQLVNKYPDHIRLVHKHFPLDELVNPIVEETVHPGSGLISLFAIIAQDAGKFWKVNDSLFRDAREKKMINIGAIAKEVGLDLSNFHKMIREEKRIKKLERDIRSGLKLEITSTPSYAIGDDVYSGTIPQKVFSQALVEN